MKIAPGLPVLAVTLLETVFKGDPAEVPILPVVEETVRVGAIRVPAVSVMLPDPFTISDAEVPAVMLPGALIVTDPAATRLKRPVADELSNVTACV